MSRVLTVGTFDIPHSGHIELFRKCRKIAELRTPVDFSRHDVGAAWNGHYGEVIVGINTDEFVLGFKGKLPVYSFEERFTVISGMRDVDRVIENPSSSLQSMLAIQKPDFLVVGSDWAKKDYYKQIGVSEYWLKEYGITLLYVPYTEGISSTQMRKRILGEST